MRTLLVVPMTLILAAATAGCASGPTAVHMKEGAVLAGYEQDEKHCQEVGMQAMRDYGKGPTQTAASTPVYSDPKYGAAPAIAASGTASFMSGLEKGKAKGAAYKAAYDDCFAEKGYRRVQLTEAEQGAYKALSSEAQKEQMAHWVSGKDRPEGAR